VLKVYNSLAQKKQAFRPLRRGKVAMYACGVTVYDHSHLGHARSAIVFDVIRRYLEYAGYKVTYVRNFTDVDDKIIQRANREGLGWKVIAETYIRSYNDDMKRLAVRPATIEPKATEYLDPMLALIKKLIRSSYAYCINGDVYFRVRRFKKYGRLSGRRVEELLSGARVEVDERKEDPLDFALWKSSKPGEPGWESPWGPGRPGWHIECSVMSMALLGKTFDIHGGGKDLTFPHHENEIAQSEAASGKTFARYWLHNGFVTVDREKMSKSLGNFFTIREIFEKSPWANSNVTAEAVRYLLLSTHYRSPIDWSDAALFASKAGLDNFYDLFMRLKEQKSVAGRADRDAGKALRDFTLRFKKAMDDDFNTSAVVAEFQKLRAAINRAMKKGLSGESADQVCTAFKKLGGVLGLFQLDPESWQVSVARSVVEVSVRDNMGATQNAQVLSDEQVRSLVMERQEARRNKDWAKADVVRKRLGEAGILLEDRPDGTVRIKR
jgi:cysteinyl-tRNA synthetase